MQSLQSAASPTASQAPSRRPLLRKEYERLVELGTFGEEKLELIEGEIVRMSPQGVPHAFAIELLTERLFAALGGRARVRVQLPFAAGDSSLPEPDLAVIAPDGPRKAHPDEALLIIEVAQTSLDYDLEVKVPLYARSKVAELWVVDVEGQQVIVHTNARGGRWSRVETLGRGAQLVPGAFPDVSVPVDALFEG
jgi:Uma2 family endonuclease